MTPTRVIPQQLCYIWRSHRVKILAIVAVSAIALQPEAAGNRLLLLHNLMVSGEKRFILALDSFFEASARR